MTHPKILKSRALDTKLTTPLTLQDLHDNAANEMNWAEAFTLSQEKHVRIRHRFFGNNEWLQVLPNQKIRFEDGVECTQFEFWQVRHDQREAWKTGWYVWNKE